MSLLKNLSNAKLDETTRITFVYEQGTDVFHFNETHVETALEETDVVERLAHVITRQLPLQMPYVGDPLGQLRDHDLLNDYARDGDFETYVQEQLRDNFYDLEMKIIPPAVCVGYPNFGGGNANARNQVT